MPFAQIRSVILPALTAASLVLGAHAAAAQGAGGPGGGGAAGQGGLSPDTPTISPTPPGVSAPAGGGPKTPLPPRDTPRAVQPGQGAGGDGPKTALPPRDTPRAPQPGGRQVTADPDWPCVQVKVPALSYGQMWAGPPLDEGFKTWRDQEDVADLVGELAARRTKIEDAKVKIANFAKSAAPDPDAKLTALFAGVFEEINGQRSRIMSGIERYSQKQRQLSEKIKTESLKMAAEQKDMAAQNSPEAMQQQQALDWDTRIYEERSHQLTYVCDSPVLLEQRAFDLGREIQSHLAQKNQ